MRRAPAAAIAAALTVLAATPAHAADPGRWTETGLSTVPIVYYQGVASDPAKRLFFNGIYTGLYRTDPLLGETARNDDVIPADVHAREQYNHIGDIAWDAREGGRVLLPMECYYPRARPDQADPNNTCNTGSIGIGDPETLQWRYYVKIDPAVMAKVMWVAVSPDGKLAWTGIGKDLFAFDMDDIAQKNAAPGGPAIKPVRTLKDARPPSGVTGAAFFRGKFYVAGQDAPEGFQVWSVDLDTGARQLEIEKQIVGESEGIDFFEGLGGQLHWLIQPYNTQGPPTYGTSNGTLLHFVPKGETGPSSPGSAKISLAASPRHIRSGKATRMTFTVRARIGGTLGPVKDARVEFGGRSATTDENGGAVLTVKIGRAAVHRARATRPDLRPGKANVRVMPARR
jgi:hypothetical protein